MNRTEAAVLLTYVARVDHRTFGDDDAKAFAELLDDIDFTPAMEAAREHLRNETDWLTPAILRRRVFTMHSARADDKPVDFALTEPDADPDDVTAYQEAMRKGQVRAEDPDVRPRPVAELLAGSFGRMPDMDAKAQGQRASVSRELFAGYAAETKRVRGLVMSHPDLREALTRQPIGYPEAEQWNGYIPPALDGMGQLNTSPRRTALAALAAEADRRGVHLGGRDSADPAAAFPRAPWQTSTEPTDQGA